MVRDILNHLLEADDEGFKEVYAPGYEEYSLQQIRAAAPEFFSRKNARTFGSRKVYKYKGNYVVIQNVKKVPGHGMFSLPEIRRTWVIYQWKRTEDTPKGDLFYVAHADDLEDAKAMIKRQDFRPHMARLRQELGLGEAEDFKELFHPEVHEIQVQGKEWWRRGAGGMYHTAKIWVNGKLVHVLPENGGTNDAYLYNAFRWLQDNGYVTMERNEAPTSYCRRMGINLIKGVTEVRRERDLDRPMGEAQEDEETPKYFAVPPPAWSYHLESDDLGYWQATLLHRKFGNTKRQGGFIESRNKKEVVASAEKAIERFNELEREVPWDGKRVVWYWYREHRPGTDYGS